MINLNDMIEAEIESGYGDANAQAKVCQDVILKAISASSLSRNKSPDIGHRKAFISL